MIADMISMMPDHGIRVEIVPLQPPIKFSGLSEVLPANYSNVLLDGRHYNLEYNKKSTFFGSNILIQLNPLSSHLHWLNFATKLGNLFCMTSSTTSPNSVESNSIFRTGHFSSAVVATNTFQELGYATALRKYLLQGAVSVSEFKIWNNMCKRFAGWTSRPDPRAVGGAHLNIIHGCTNGNIDKISIFEGSTEELNVPRILGKNFPIAEGIRLRENSPSGPKVPSLERGTSCPMWVEHGTQFADASMESTSFQQIEKMEPCELRPGGNSIGILFGTIGTVATLSATQWTTGLSGSLDHLHQKQAEVPVIFTRENCGLKAKQMVNHDLDEPGTCRNLGELANVGHCCGRLNIGIGIRACHPQNCQSACPVTEWNEMELPGVNCWHQQSLQDLQATRSGLLAQWKLHVKSENEEVDTIRNKITKVLEIRSKAITGLPALLDFHTD
ncbi:hypothetical protein B0H14DRAFT_2637334 [Mycena olivaceomarginata]|nr:hypothetical protein B0H14DRAFT_2637334 [Mycena olivaceomarginata]